MYTQSLCKLLILIEVLISMNALAVPTFGFMPLTFPRDPVAFNQYLEHVAIGQILEPLVGADKDGNIVPGLAETWKVSRDGKTVTFKLRKNVLFSSGQKLQTQDVVASIERNRTDRQSQSYPLLRNIEKIFAKGNNVIVVLRRPQVAIFKILSRDQLGVQPKNWRFDPNSDEPYLGTGPYRLVRKSGEWYFVANQRYRDPSKVKIKKWKILFKAPSKEPVVIPDYFPFATLNNLHEFKTNHLLKKNQYQIHEVLSFIQNSAWWNPHGAHYKQKSYRDVQLAAISKLFALRTKHLGLKRATGIIPFGVAGYQPKPIPVAKLTKKQIAKFIQHDPSIKNISVAIPKHLVDQTFEQNDRKQVERELGVHFELHVEMLNPRIAPKTDIIIDRWAGGFNDPEGFIPIITDVIHMPLQQYLGGLWKMFINASTELDWEKRIELYREFNMRLVQGQRLVPGWKTPIYSLLKHGLKESVTLYRYTPRLTDIGFTK